MNKRRIFQRQSYQRRLPGDEDAKDKPAVFLMYVVVKWVGLCEFSLTCQLDARKEVPPVDVKARLVS